MELAIVVYLVSLFDGIGSSLVVTTTALTLAACVACGICSEGSLNEDLWLKRCYNLAKSLLFTIPILSTFVWIVPDKETSYTMLAVYGAQEIVQSDEATRIMGKSVEVFEAYMDDYLEELNQDEPEKTSE